MAEDLSGNGVAIHSLYLVAKVGVYPSRSAGFLNELLHFIIGIAGFVGGGH